ncbi:glycosyltransferase [Geobacter sulfurreducens subsp. ethanolicus]|nr:glycosyltransferase [Geobacter sulfurreducens subsp. ethanolicus]
MCGRAVIPSIQSHGSIPMASFSVDILVPVWNRPVETRSCLVSLVESAPEARLILIDNGSDRETERLLEEFAERLGERALLLRNDITCGFVPAVNRGLSRAEAPFVVIVRNTTVVAPGWLEPLVELATARSETGLAVPRLVLDAATSRRGRRRPDVRVTEVSHGSFAAMLIRRSLFERMGGFDEELDGDVWCLRDYSRRALAEGYLTFAAEGVPVVCRDEVLLGSPGRRRELVDASAAAVATRWGQAASYLVYFPSTADPEVVRTRFSVLLRAARMGHLLTVAIGCKLRRTVSAAGLGSVHRSIVVEELPRFFAPSALRRIVDRCAAEGNDPVCVAGIDGVDPPGEMPPCRPFAWFENEVGAREEAFYRRGANGNPVTAPADCVTVTIPGGTRKGDERKEVAL